jgi:hypothetical protein
MTNLLNTLLRHRADVNLFALGTSRIVSVIRTVAVQGALLGLLLPCSCTSTPRSPRR